MSSLPAPASDSPSGVAANPRPAARRVGAVLLAALMGVVLALELVFARYLPLFVPHAVLELLCIGAAAWLGARIVRERLDNALRDARTEEKARLNQLAEMQQIAHLGTWERNLVTGELLWSDELYRIMGIPSGTPLTFADLLRTIHPQDTGPLQVALRQCIETGEPYSFEYRVLQPAGEERWILSRGRLVKGPTGALDRLVGTAQDVTAKRVLQERMLVSDRLASLGTLAGGVAHEINNPLMYIVGNLDFIEGQIQANASLIEAVREARQGADRVRRIVQDLKTFSRAKGDEGGPGDVRRSLELSINMTRNELRQRATLVVEIGDLPPVVGNESRLGQVFVNLLLNAAHSIPPGAPDRNRVKVRAMAIGSSEVIVEIEDTGSGMGPEVRQRIFEPFFTTKPVGAGTGLGLAICHGIIRSMGGEIACETEAGRGTLFRIRLPAALEGSQVVLAPTATRTIAARRGRILVVDDDPLVGAALQRALVRAHDVTLARSGQEALQRVQAGDRFDLILCDLMMPGVTAMDVHAGLMAVDSDQLSRVVLMSGGAVSAVTQAFIERVQNPYLDKPVDPRQVEQLVLERLS